MSRHQRRAVEAFVLGLTVDVVFTAVGVAEHGVVAEGNAAVRWLMGAVGVAPALGASWVLSVFLLFVLFAALRGSGGSEQAVPLAWFAGFVHLLAGAGWLWG